VSPTVSTHVVACHNVLGGVIDSFDNLIEYSPEWFRRFGVQVKHSTEVTAVDAGRRFVTMVSLANGEEETIDYDNLVIATGSIPKVPPIPGITRHDGSLIERVFTLRTIEDALGIARAIDSANHCLIIGAGLIGLETAEALRSRMGSAIGQVSLVDTEPHVLATMVDPDMARVLEDSVASHGVDFLPSTTVTQIQSEVQCHVKCRSARGEESSHSADLIVVAVGCNPDIALGKMAGCLIGPTGGIVVDGCCRTSISGVYAAGDCTEYRDFVTGHPLLVGLGSVAVRQGRVAGINAVGGVEQVAEGLLNSRTTRLFGLEVAAVGPTQCELQERGINPIVGKVTSSTRPAYFPGGKRITVKLLVHPDDARLIGAQVVGDEGVHLRADVLATAILSSMKVGRFLQLETCYAPSVAPTLDCVTLAAEAAYTRWTRDRRDKERTSD